MGARIKQHLRWASLLAALLCGCGEDLIRNPEVNRWCGDTPCDWQVHGEIKRVGSWHKNDYAVALVSDDASLTQENATIDYTDSDCFSFAMVAKIDRGVPVYLELDFLADGSAEFSQRLPTSDWQRRTFKVTAPDWYRKVRFIIRKDGPGRAILAEISATNADGQCSAPAVELRDRPDGAGCSSDEDCASGGCSRGSCGGCADDEACAEGQVCGLVYVDNDEHHACVERASMTLAAACDRDAQCESGVCADGACSECATDADCAADAGCRIAAARPVFSRFWPKLCGPGEMLRSDGASCTSDRDCESGSCEGFEVSCEPDLACRSSSGNLCSMCVPQLQLGVCRPG